ncbi:MAG: restriction endonuclease subunit S, partial [Selenomonadaceae bacterium]|nr:restriction endonuclease subunit S [Selenomonadaceae bacterium]
KFNETRIRRQKFMLPVNDKGEPDYNFMENYVRAVEEKQLQRYRDYVQALDAAKIPPLNEKIWRPFFIKDLFRLESGKCSQANQLKKSDNGIPYIGATNRNNGVMYFVCPVEKLIQRGNCIAFIKQGEGSVGYSVYKEEDFIASTSIALGYADFLNKYVGLFITTVADKVRGRYSYNYPRSEARLRREKLMLPINDSGAPDFDYMEAYVKNSMAAQYRKYLEYLGDD